MPKSILVKANIDSNKRPKYELKNNDKDSIRINYLELMSNRYSRGQGGGIPHGLYP